MANLTLFRVKKLEIRKPFDLGNGRMVTIVDIDGGGGRFEVSLHSDGPLEIKGVTPPVIEETENECVVDGVVYRAEHHSDCDGCAFLFGSLGCKATPPCSEHLTPDGKSLIWKRVDA